MSLRPPPSPHPSPSVTSASEDDEYDIPELALAPSDQAPAPWDGSPDANAHTPLPIANHLPHEILIYILKFVPSHSDLHSSLLVSRQWCQCTVELLWHKPVFTKVSSLFKLISILSLARHGDAQTPFDSPREEYDPPRRALTFPYPIFLRRLNFALLGADCTDSIFARLFLCTRLERLTLANCTSLTSPALAYILPQLRCLVALDMTNVGDLNDSALDAIATSCTRLQGINLTNCTKITDDGIRSLARHSRLLRRVKLCGLTEVTDKAFAELAAGCPLLLEVDLNGCIGVEDDTPRVLFTHARQLRELKLAQCLAVTDDAFPLPPLPIPAPIGAAYTRSLNPHLYSLPVGVTFDHLRMLDLTNCLLLTDDSLDRVISNSLRIRNLVLAKCSGLSEDCVESIGKLGKHLHYLHLGHVANITDRSITVLSRTCTRLRYIDLACCPLLTDMSVFELSTLAKLRRIGLVRVANLTDNALFSLAERHSTLERIHLSYCENISVPAVHFLLQRLGRLTHLSLTGVPAFRRPELQKYCRTPPKEFNDNQRSTFCVYSGKGVHDLRKYLAAIASTPFPFTPAGESDSDTSTTPPPDPQGDSSHDFPIGQNLTSLPHLEGLSLNAGFNTGPSRALTFHADNAIEDEPIIDVEAGTQYAETETQTAYAGPSTTSRLTFGETEPVDPTGYTVGYTGGVALASSSSAPVQYSGSHTPQFLQIPPAGSQYRHSPAGPSSRASSAATSVAATPNTPSFAPAMPSPFPTSGSTLTPDLELGEGDGSSEERILVGQNLAVPNSGGPGGAEASGSAGAGGNGGRNERASGQSRTRTALGFLFRRSRSRERDAER